MIATTFLQTNVVSTTFVQTDVVSAAFVQTSVLHAPGGRMIATTVLKARS